MSLCPAVAGDLCSYNDFSALISSFSFKFTVLLRMVSFASAFEHLAAVRLYTVMPNNYVRFCKNQYFPHKHGPVISYWFDQ